MNLKDFTVFCLENMGKTARCKKDKPVTGVDIGCRHLHRFIITHKGEEFKIGGFVCCFDERSLLLEDEKSYDEFINFDEFIEYFEIIKTPPSLSTNTLPT